MEDDNFQHLENEIDEDNMITDIKDIDDLEEQELAELEDQELAELEEQEEQEEQELEEQEEQEEQEEDKMDILRSGIHNNGNQCFINASIQCLSVSPFIHSFIKNYEYADVSIWKTIIKYKLNDYQACDIPEHIKELLDKDKTISEDDKQILISLQKNCIDYYIYICFKQIIEKLKHKKESAINIASNLKIIQDLTGKTGFSHLFSGEQNDPHEFMVYILDRLHNAKSSKVIMDFPESIMKGSPYIRIYLEHFKKRYENDFSLFVKNFYYYILNCIECFACKNITFEASPNDIICVPLPTFWKEKDITLYDCLDEYFKVERIDYKCEKCQNTIDNRQDKKLLTRPKTLIIKIKRYNMIGNSLMKINKYIEYPQQLQLGKYLCNSNDQPYKLYGVINHIGFLNGGHYYSFLRDYNPETETFNEDWLACNDSKVNKISINEAIRSNHAYMLFYQST